MYKKEDLDIITKIILDKIHFAKKIYLFGSYANNTADNESDIDIAVLLSKQIEWKERKDILNYLYHETSKNGIDVDFVVKTERNFNEERELPTLSRIIYNEGKILWQTQ